MPACNNYVLPICRYQARVNLHCIILYNTVCTYDFSCIKMHRQIRSHFLIQHSDQTYPAHTGKLPPLMSLFVHASWFMILRCFSHKSKRQHQSYIRDKSSTGTVHIWLAIKWLILTVHWWKDVSDFNTHFYIPISYISLKLLFLYLLHVAYLCILSMTLLFLSWLLRTASLWLSIPWMSGTLLWRARKPRTKSQMIHRDGLGFYGVVLFFFLRKWDRELSCVSNK